MPNFKHGQTSFLRGKLSLPGGSALQSVLSDIAFSSQVKIVRDALGEDGVKKFLRETEKRNRFQKGTLNKYRRDVLGEE